MKTLTININNDLNNLKRIENLNPSDYEIFGLMYKVQVDENDFAIESEIYDDGTFEKSDMYASLVGDIFNKKVRCNHCNKTITYVCLGLNTTDGTIHSFGHKCTENINTFRNFDKVIENAQKKSLNARVREKNRKLREDFMDENEGLREALAVNNKMIISIRETFIKYNKMSDKQVELVLKLAKQQAEFDVKNTERESGAKDVPTERVKDNEFKVISVKRDEGFNGIVYKSVLEHTTDMYRVYGNLPIAIMESTELIKVGDVITASATLTKSDKNPKFGFFKVLKLAK